LFIVTKFLLPRR